MKGLARRRERGWAAAILIGLAALSLLPLARPRDDVLNFVVVMLLAITMAESWNIAAGYAGQVNLGHAAFFGLGALVARTLWIKGAPIVLAMLAGTVVATAFALLIGVAAFRLRGAYFAIGTLALAESAKQLALAWDRLTGIPLTGGSAGVSLPLSAGYLVFYYVMLGLTTAVTAAAFWLRGSKFGYGLRAVGENDRLAEASGVDIHRLKRRVYVGSALAIAVTGGTAGYWLSYINAAEVFSASMTFQMVVMALLGGIGTPLGPVLGAAFLTLASEFLGTRFVYHYLIAIGVIIVGISLFAPAGLSGLLDLAWRRRARVFL